MGDDVPEAEQMRTALAAIADEMQRLHNDSLNSNESEVCESEDVLLKLIKCKSSLKCKKEEITKLKQNLKTACFIAKTVTSAKEKESALLNNHLNFARNQYLELIQQHKGETDLINKLKTENQNLQDKLQYFDHIIDLGYREVQKMRNESVENIPTLQQLKKIILCCGEYYANYSNEHDKCVQLEQKNRFFGNKLRILESDMVVPPHCNIKNHKNDVKNKATSFRSSARKPREVYNIGVVCSEYQMNNRQNKISNVTMTKIELDKRSIITKSKDLDLTSHFDLVKTLLHDQDTLLSDLKNISKEIVNLDALSE